MWLYTLLCSECFVIIFDWYHSPCLSGDPPNVDDLGRAVLLGGALHFGFGVGGSASLQLPPASPCLNPSLGASRVGFGPCPTCGHEVESNAVKALQCVRKLWFWGGIGITSSFPPAFQNVAPLPNSAVCPRSSTLGGSKERNGEWYQSKMITKHSEHNNVYNHIHS